MDKYLEDLQEIKDIMARSARFISLSGLSGISAGILALAGAFLAYRMLFQGQEYLTYAPVDLTSDQFILLLSLAMGTLVLAMGSAIFFTTRQARLSNQPIWDHQTKRLLINFLIPLIAGGLICLMLLTKGFVGLVVPLSLVFYGLGLVNASKYTLSEARSLGLVIIGLGLIAMQFIGYGLVLWAIGFGIFHIVSGIMIRWKYQS